MSDLCHGLLYPARLLCPQFIPRQEYWSGLPFPSPWDLCDPGIKPRSLQIQTDSLPSESAGSPMAQEDKIKALSMPHNPYGTSPYLFPQPHLPSDSPPATHQTLLPVLSPTAHGSPCPHFLVILFPLFDLAWADCIYISQTISLIYFPPFSKSPLRRLLEPWINLLSPFYMFSSHCPH